MKRIRAKANLADTSTKRATLDPTTALTCDTTRGGNTGLAMNNADAEYYDSPHEVMGFSALGTVTMLNRMTPGLSVDNYKGRGYRVHSLKFNLSCYAPDEDGDYLQRVAFIWDYSPTGVEPNWQDIFYLVDPMTNTNRDNANRFVELEHSVFRVMGYHQKKEFAYNQSYGEVNYDVDLTHDTDIQFGTISGFYPAGGIKKRTHSELLTWFFPPHAKSTYENEYFVKLPPDAICLQKDDAVTGDISAKVKGALYVAYITREPFNVPPNLPAGQFNYRINFSSLSKE